MLSDSLRARLEALNREPIPATLEDERAGSVPEAFDDFGEEPIVNQPIDDRATRRRRRPQRDPDEGESLEELVPGRVVENAVGPHYLVTTPLETLWAESGQRITTYHQRTADESATTGEQPTTRRMSRRRQQRLQDVTDFRQYFTGRTLFLDLETCGFSGSPLFLVGVVRADDDDRLVVDQLLARDYTEERAVLESLWQLAAESRVLVTFNGKSFDWPMVHDRSTFHRLGRRRRAEADSSREPLPTPLGPKDRRPHLAHIDVLHHARRRWRRQLPNCKLQTLERYVCRRKREDDIPGSQVPAAYHNFVRSGDAWQLRSILQHNAIDLVTLVQLSMTLFIPPRSSTAEGL